MIKEKTFSMGLALTVFLTFGQACQYLKGSQAEEKKAEISTATENQNLPEKMKDRKKGIVSADDSADFTVSSEEIFKEYSANKKTIKAPEKYVNKIIAITGRVAYLEPERKGSLAPRVALKGGSSPIIDVVTCEFDEENKEEITRLRKDQSVRLQGLSPEMWLMTPTLQHCVVVE